MGDEHDRLLHLGLEPQELVLEAVPCYRVDRTERLVHQHHRRVRSECTRDAHTLRLPTGQLLGVAVAVQIRLQADQIEQFVRPGGGPCSVPPEQARDRADVLSDRLVREEPDALDDVADATTQLRRVHIGDVLAIEDDPSGRRLDHPVDEAQRRGLAAPGRTDEHEDLALVDVQRQLLHGRYGPGGVDLLHAVEADHDRSVGRITVTHHTCWAGVDGRRGVRRAVRALAHASWLLSDG